MFVARVVLQTNDQGIGPLVNQLSKETVEVPKAFAGCDRFDVAVHVTDPHRVVIVEEWVDRAAADVYLNSDYFAAAGSILRPLLVAPPESAYYDAELVGP